MGQLTDIPKRDTHNTEGPCWLPAADSEGNACKPLIKCKCGAIMDIEATHHVHASGLVTPSFHHDFHGCGWHVWLRLLDYDQGDFPPVK